MKKTLTFDHFAAEVVKYKGEDADIDAINDEAMRRMRAAAARLIDLGYIVVGGSQHEALGLIWEYEAPASVTFDLSVVPEKYIHELIAELHSKYDWNATGARERSELRQLLEGQLLAWSRKMAKEAELINAYHSNTSYSCFEHKLWLPTTHNHLHFNFPYTIRSNEFRTPEDFTFSVVDFYKGTTPDTIKRYKTIQEALSDLQARGYPIPMAGPEELIQP